MGIPELFNVIKDHEEIIPIAQLAEDHHRRYGRPLRIAIDEADWRFNNLTQAQVYAIRDTSDMAYQGQEKSMFYRICRFLTFNIQLVFVFDGPGRPWKHGKRGQGKINYRERDLLKEVLRAMGIPFHEAPGEAEAECARLQILGLVDAVWSQDSDSMMFGCTLWIRDNRVVKEKGTTDQSKENTQKSKKTARVVRAEVLKERLQLDREALVLFAMLVGGDYDKQGLPGCGASTAKQIIKKGLAPSLCACRNQRDCDIWALLLAAALPRGIGVPFGFPDFKTLVKYNSPKVTSDEILRNHPQLKVDYVRPINELKLLEVTSSRFNIWGRLYMNWVGPILLTRCLSDSTSRPTPEVTSSIKLVKQKAGHGGLAGPVLERKLSFSPFGLTTLCRQDFEGERLGYWNGDRTTLFDPDYRVENCEMPNYWLQKALPRDVLDPPPPVAKSRTNKRKNQAEASSPAQVAVTKKRSRKEPKSKATNHQTSPMPKALSPATPTNQRNPKDAVIAVIELSDSDEELRIPASRQASKFSARPAVSHTVELYSPISSKNTSCLKVPNESDSLATLQTPSSAGQGRPQFPLDIYEIEEERDLQLALQLSVRECASTPQTCGRSSLTGASSQGLSAQGESAFDTPSFTTRRNKQAPNRSSNVRPTPQFESEEASIPKEHQPTTWDGFSTTGAHIQHPTSGRDSRFDVDTCNPSSRTSQPGGSLSEFPRLDSPPLASPTIEDIRAARIRHFQSFSAATPAINGDLSSTQPRAAPIRPNLSASHVSSGIDFIDLTDD